MILYSFFIILIVALIIIFSFRTVNGKKSKKSYLKLKFFLFTFLSLIATTLYLKLSNYWIGETVLEKIETQTNIENRKANEIAIIKEAMISLEKELIKSPKSLETIIELAETKFLLGYLNEALNLYKNARMLAPKNINVLKAETQVRVLLENNSVSQETLGLLRNIISVEPDNKLALYILGNYEYKKNNFFESKKMFKALKKLLNKNTQEYEEINNKILEMEKENEK